MKISPSWASVALPIALASAESTTTSASATTTSTAPSCTASLITSLCDYPTPGPDFAVASSGKEFCWEYCNEHTPCSFVIFREGNPYTGTGTCWLYPGETFDASKGSSDCGNPYLDVYDQPECTSTTPTSTTTAACTATATPSAIASVCGYPAPETCFSTCIASSRASHCLSECAEADSCTYAIFNPHNPSNSPYADGTCWVYTEGSFDAANATECDGEPTQFVYENPCPSEKSVSPSSSSSENGTETETGTAVDETGSETEAGTAVAASGSNSTPTGENAAPGSLSGSGSVGFLFAGSVALGVAMLV